MRTSPFTTLWEFHVKPDRVSAFEEVYRPDGTWAQFFRSSPDYLGTELIRDFDRPGRYLTLDHWISRAAFRRFKQDRHAEYAAFDKQCESLTEREAFLGDFERIESPAR